MFFDRLLGEPEIGCHLHFEAHFEGSFFFLLNSFSKRKKKLPKKLVGTYKWQNWP